MASGQPPGTDPTIPWNQPSPSSSVPQPNRPSHGPPQFILTPEEQQVMKECERDSFYKRALPLGLGCMFGAQMMVKSGRWNAHPRFGALPKVLIAGGIGYFVGKIMYLPVCQQKILDRIPNSNLAAAIRKSKQMPEPESPVAVWEDSSSDNSRDASSSGSSSRKKEDYSALEGLDDRFRPSMDRDVKTPDSSPQDKPPVTYEELRRRNRQEYEESLAKRPPKPPGAPSYKDSPYMPQRPWPEAGDKGKAESMGEDSDSPGDSQQNVPPLQPPPRRKRTNMWGDPVED